MNKIFIFFVVIATIFSIFGCSKADPELKVSPKELDFETELTQKEFTIKNVGKAKGLFESGVETLKYNITPNNGWISVDPTSGKSSGETDNINVTIERSMLADSLNEGSIDITSNGGNETVQVFALQGEGIIYNPYPENNAENIPVSLTLTWECTNAIQFSLYLDENNPPITLISDSLLISSYNIAGLNYSTIYYWKVVATIEDKEEIQSPVWSFTTEDEDIPPAGYRMIQHGDVETELPAWVKIMFQVTTMDSIGINYLTTEDFEIEEDGEPVPYGEAGMQIKKKGDLPYTLKTVLMLDNSNSVAEDLPEVKNAAIEFVNNIEVQQEISLYVFSSDWENLSNGFTDDTSLLIDAINSITPGAGSTNLYGSLIEGLNSWEDIYSEDEIIQGALIVFTDGTDTQGSSTLPEVLNARGSKRLYTIGLGTEHDANVILQQLANPSSGFYYLDNVSELIESFNQIQEDMALFADSFYWLHYLSPKTEGTHTVTLSIENNINTGSDSYIEDNFNANGFEPPIAGLFVNATPSDPYGIDDLTISDTIAFSLDAVTYYNQNPPDYFWVSADTNIVRIEVDDIDNSIANVFANGQSGETTITVYDNANTDWEGNILEKTINVDCTIESAVYINATPSNPEGINEFVICEEDTLTLIATTYLGNNPPEYVWESGDTEIIELTVDPVDFSIAYAIAVGDSGQTTTIIIQDVANGLEKTIIANVVNYSVPIEGLIAEYLFTNGSTEDTSGNNNHGQNNGAIATSDRFGNTNSAYDFDGVDDWIEVAHDSVQVPSNQMSVCAWIKIDNIVGEYFAISKGQEVPYSLGSRLNKYWVKFGTTSNNALNLYSTTTPDNQWHFIIGTYDGTEAKIYVDGIEHTSAMLSDNLIFDENPLAIGREAVSQWNYFPGPIDDIRIYNRALTEDEIQALYNEGGWGR
ncbi:MAG: VWA domain-containing protein [Candidatus Cloacimonetes bacterium]|nr:VWA domain-containing protein [Candidatus Cloacimonadota bacterium]